MGRRPASRARAIQGIGRIGCRTYLVHFPNLEGLILQHSAKGFSFSYAAPIFWERFCGIFPQFQNSNEIGFPVLYRHTLFRSTRFGFIPLSGDTDVTNCGIDLFIFRSLVALLGTMMRGEPWHYHDARLQTSPLRSLSCPPLHCSHTPRMHFLFSLVSSAGLGMGHWEGTSGSCVFHVT